MRYYVPSLLVKGECMTHDELWVAIKNLAADMNISCSRLAKISGLDPTTFNQRRHKSKYGQDRWISTYTLSRVMDAAGLTLAEFAQFLPSDTHVQPRCSSLQKHPVCDKHRSI